MQSPPSRVLPSIRADIKFVVVLATSALQLSRPMTLSFAASCNSHIVMAASCNRRTMTFDSELLNTSPRQGVNNTGARRKPQHDNTQSSSNSDVFPQASFSSASLLPCSMVVIREVVRSNGLSFAMQRKAVSLRGEGMSFNKIAKKVKNLKNKKTTEDTVRRACKRFNVAKGRATYNYSKCGRKPWLVTRAVSKFLIRRLCVLRKTTICTSTTLQEVLAQEMRVKLEVSTIRKHLKKKGYQWLPRAQKRAYSAADKKLRLTLAKRLNRMSAEELEGHITMSMDGVIIPTAPTQDIERRNFCLHGETHMWRKPSEACTPELAGGHKYADQVPLYRAIPFWGAISSKGYCDIVYHAKKKIDTREWVDDALKSGKLFEAIKKLRTTSVGGYRILCDNESFLASKASKEFYGKKNIQLLQIPPRSPDLNPIEMFWGWVRKQMRLKDLEDLRAKRPPLGKTASKKRLRMFLKTRKAQTVAANCFKKLRSKCREVIAKKGAAIRS